MKESLNSSKVIVALLMLSALALPVLLNVSIACWIVIALVRLVVPEQRKAMISLFKKNRLLQILPALYLLHVIGLIWTDNLKYAGLDLQIKLTLLLLPFAIGTSQITKSDRINVLKSFVGGCIIASIYLLINAFKSFSATNNVHVFFYTDLCSVLMHPTYLTMYINLAIIVLLYLIISAKAIRTQSISAIVLYFMVLMSILLSARTAQASIVITSILFVLMMFKSFQLKSSGIAVSATVILMAIPTHLLLTKLNNRYTQVENAIATPTQEGKVEYNSTTGRMEIWKESFEVLKDNWLLGTGTGDIKDELVNTYKSHDFKYGYEKQLNTHNEYLQIWLSIGLIGLILILLVHLIPVIQFRSYPDLIFPIFMIICGLNALTEATLETQRGVLFFAFFFSLMAVNSKASE
ncbi:MAG TPA: O-antigen ligase family protein [Bacteroidia bacterium]|nr:O-antigen ligase family protein [Bacteroidia bacterium]